jgi:hypothetical protein
MKKDITEIIKTALELDKDQIELYFEFEQKESGQNPILFLGFLKKEIKKQRKEFDINFSQIDDEDYAASIINSYSGNDFIGFQKRACGLYILEEVVKKQLHLLRKANKNSSDIFWIPEQDFISIDFSTFIEDDDSDDLKSLEKISESCLKEDLEIDDAITDTKNPDVQDKDSQQLVFENKINRMPIDQVRLFFTPLIETENNAGENWMEPEAFEIFIRRSFAGEESLLKPDINLGKGTKGAIVKLFYKFYWHCIGENHTSRREKKPYVKLLRNAFKTGIFNNLDDDSFNGKANWDWPDFKSKV